MLRPTPNASIDTERVAAECVRWFYHARARYILPSPRLVITYQHGRAILSREHGRQRVATEHVGAQCLDAERVIPNASRPNVSLLNAFF